MEDRFEVFTRSIAQISRCVQRIKNTEMGDLGLRGMHAMCLYFLGQNPQGLTAAQLCEKCGEDRAAMSRAVAQLEARDYVQCHTEAGRRKYRAPLTLTAAGVPVAQEVHRRVERALADGGDGLTPSEREAFYAALWRIVENLQGVCERSDAEKDV